jgi:hypothetical protein
VVANGTACGPGRVCNGGTCLDCAAGVACMPEDPCHVGVVSCAGGSAVCQDTGVVASNGSTCGLGKVCNSGACVDCLEGVVCIPGDPCHEGAVSCATGSPVCQDTGVAAACTPANPCHEGGMSCATEEPLCVDLGIAVADGTVCGPRKMCSGGDCVDCVNGAPCTPEDPCHRGGMSCTTSGPRCIDSAAAAADGTPCGTDRVCSNGACVACAAGLTCVPDDPCHEGRTSCTSGAAACVDMEVVLDNGTPCGTDRVCSNGACVDCAAGLDCVPDDPCHEGRISCASGAPVCVDAETAVDNGTPCGTDRVCTGGVCVDCVEGAPCIPENACHEGTTSCAQGLLCDDTAVVLPDWASCGTTRVCYAGLCWTLGCAPGSSSAPPDCDLHGVPRPLDHPRCGASGEHCDGGDAAAGDHTPTWHERAQLVALNAARSAPAPYRDAFVESSDGSHLNIFDSDPVPRPPVFWDHLASEGARFHSTDRLGCFPLHLPHSQLCDGTPAQVWGHWFGAYFDQWGQVFFEGAALMNRDAPLAVMNGYICGGSMSATYQLSGCAHDNSGWDEIRQWLAFYDYGQIGFGAAYEDVGPQMDWTIMLVVSPPPFGFPMASGSHFYHAGSIVFALTVYSAGIPALVSLIVDGAEAPLSHIGSVGTPTLATYLRTETPLASCRSYHFLLADDDGVLWRYPARGELRTYGEGSCTEDYLP